MKKKKETIDAKKLTIEVDLDGRVTNEPTPCPKCNSLNNEYGYGFAYGGLGGYITCGDCGEFISKTQDLGEYE